MDNPQLRTDPDRRCLPGGDFGRGSVPESGNGRGRREGRRVRIPCDRKVAHRFPEAVHHVMARGNQGQAVFRSDLDRRMFLDTLDEG